MLYKALITTRMKGKRRKFAWDGLCLTSKKSHAIKVQNHDLHCLSEKQPHLQRVRPGPQHSDSDNCIQMMAYQPMEKRGAQPPLRPIRLMQGRRSDVPLKSFRFTGACLLIAAFILFSEFGWHHQSPSSESDVWKGRYNL
jgi:hypothetical protein